MGLNRTLPSASSGCPRRWPVWEWFPPWSCRGCPPLDRTFSRFEEGAAMLHHRSPRRLPHCLAWFFGRATIQWRFWKGGSCRRNAARLVCSTWLAITGGWQHAWKRRKSSSV